MGEPQGGELKQTEEQLVLVHCKTLPLPSSARLSEKFTTQQCSTRVL